jgi:hypothetical protein
MSLSSTSAVPGLRAARAATAAGVAAVLLLPLAALFALAWSGAGNDLEAARAERRGVAYLGPLAQLLSVTTEAQSAAVRKERVDAAAVQAAAAGVDQVNGRLGGDLRTVERWSAIRQTVQDRIGRSWPDPSTAYTQYSDLVTSLVELDRKVGDSSRLILDPTLDGYYVMNAALLRLPEILVNSGRYADLTVLAARTETPSADSVAQLTTARNRVAADATDLYDGLVKAFAATRSASLGPGLTRQLDDFRTAVDAVAPSNSLLAPAPKRSLRDIAADQDALQRASLALHRASLSELDRLLRERESDANRARLLAVLAVVLGALLVVAAAIWLRPERLGRRQPAADVDDDDAVDPYPVRAGRGSDRTRGPGGPGGPGGSGGPGGPGGRPLVDVIASEPRGGTRAAR